MAELRATPQNKALATLANSLRSARETGDVVDIPVLGGLGSLLLGKSPEEVEEWSYGNAPMQMTPQGVRLPQMKRGRGQQLVDTVFAAVDRPALRSLTAAVGKSLAKALENSSLYDLARQLQESRAPISSIVKQKGGNWLTGSVEDALKGLKPRPLVYSGAEGSSYRDEDLPLVNWIEGPLTKYVKTRMASPEDEVRKLAEEGVLHFEPGWIPEGGFSRGVAASLYRDQLSPTGPGARLGKAKLAQDWEDLTDQGLDQYMADEILGAKRAASPWLEKLPGRSPVYEMPRDMQESLGFPHLIDELSNALNPASGLPRNLQVTPESLKQMSMEKAVRRVDEINKWRAATKAEANRALAEKASIVREYAENNPRGLRWVELKAADRWPEGADTQQMLAEHGDLGRYSRKQLADQLKYEGDTMGHCVGGYCDDVLSGRSRIFSLRDTKGEPHVTVEVEPPMFNRASRWGDLSQEEKTSMLWNLGSPGDKALLEKYGDDMQVYFRPDNTVRIMPPAELLDPETIGKSLNPRVKQIKGKQNRAPNPEYLPFVQDFVRNSPLGSQWSDVGDLANTGLISARDQDAMVRAALTGRPISIDEGYAAAKRLGERQPFYTQEELIEAFKNEFPDKFAQGGMVQPSWPEPEYNSWDVFAREL